MGLSDQNGGAADELVNNVGPLRFLDTKEPFTGREFRVILSDPTRYFTLDGRELEPVYKVTATGGQYIDLNKF